MTSDYGHSREIIDGKLAHYGDGSKDRHQKNRVIPYIAVRGLSHGQAVGDPRLILMNPTLAKR